MAGALDALYTGAPGEAQQILNNFWPRVLDEIKNVKINDFKTQELPLARIKKIMKLDEDVKMISAEAPVLFAKAAEIFISELTLRAWVHAEDNKRRTLQRNDIAMAITRYDQFDFLIDIVPREEIRPVKRPEDNGVMQAVVTQDQMQYVLQVAQPSATPVPSAPIIQQLSAILSPQTQMAQAQPTVTQQAASPSPAGQQTVQVFTQIVGPNGEIQQVPIQLTQTQLQAITLQMQGKQPGQSIIIQTTPNDNNGGQNGDSASAQFSPQPVFQLPMFIQSGVGQQEADQQELEDEQTEG